MSARTQNTKARQRPMAQTALRDRLLKQFKALADETRLKITAVLLNESLSVNELADQLALPQYNVSKHLRVLREAEIIEVVAVGQRRNYAIAHMFRSKKIKRNVLDLDCCTLRFDQILASEVPPAHARRAVR